MFRGLAPWLLLAAGTGALLGAPTAPPPEVTNLTASANAVSWDPVPGAVAYKLYRSDLASLPDPCALSVTLHAETAADDASIPAPGSAVTYLVSAVNSFAEGPLEPVPGDSRASARNCDTDGDGTRDAFDNCPLDVNAPQTDIDGDGLGDACDFGTVGVELLGRLPRSGFPGFPGGANDIAGYVSPDGEEYAIVGLRSGTGFVRITDPTNPRLVGYIDGMGIDQPWRDMAVFGHYAYIVSDGAGVGLQIADMSKIDDDIVTLANTSDLGMGFTEAHNVFVNSESGYLYLAIPDLFGGLGLVALDLNSDPADPTFAGNWIDSDPNVRCHDYYVRSFSEGALAGREIAYCLAENDGLRIVDVTNKSSMFRLSKLVYPNANYTHQGWLTDDGRFLLVNDELDELSDPDVSTTTTYVIDVETPTNPTLTTQFTNGSPAIDHNLMLRDGFAFEANYTSGLRVYDVCDPEQAVEVGFFDTFPHSDAPDFLGAWGVDASLPSGTVVVSDVQKGLLVVDPQQALASANRDLCVTQPQLNLPCDACFEAICDQDVLCCVAGWDSTCVRQVRTVCGSLTCDESRGSCDHTLCTTGPPLIPGCDAPPATSSCVDQICTTMPGCCDTDWSAACVLAVETVCGMNCD